MKQLQRAIDRVNGFVGKACVWLLLVSALVSAGNAIMRKAFSIGSNAMLELQWHLIGAMVMLGVAWVFKENAHVRIEILASRFNPRLRRSVELGGHLLMLVPFSALMVWLSWPFFERSYLQNEISLNSGGLLIWPIRGVIVVGFAMLLAQAVSAVIAAIEPPDTAND